MEGFAFRSGIQPDHEKVFMNSSSALHSSRSMLYTGRKGVNLYDDGTSYDGRTERPRRRDV
jgi:hypothetical protein